MRTCFELVFDETEALSLFLGFFKLDRKGPALPAEKKRLKFAQNPHTNIILDIYHNFQAVNTFENLNLKSVWKEANGF